MNHQSNHRATIRWSPEHERLGLPELLRTIDPAWLADHVPPHDDGWSLVCEFEQSPQAQGNPSAATVHFLVEAAPHAALHAGATLRLFERATGGFADVAILDQAFAIAGMLRDVSEQRFAAVCRVPSGFREGDQSLTSIVRASGFTELRSQLSPLDLAGYLRRHPALIADWVHYSEDKRTSEGWYLRPPHFVGRIVANSPAREQHYTDLAAACAAFIIAELETILDHGAAV